MYLTADRQLRTSATDLAIFLGCKHLTRLDGAHAICWIRERLPPITARRK